MRYYRVTQNLLRTCNKCWKWKVIQMSLCTCKDKFWKWEAIKMYLCTCKNNCWKWKVIQMSLCTCKNNRWKWEVIQMSLCTCKYKCWEWEVIQMSLSTHMRPLCVQGNLLPCVLAVCSLYSFEFHGTQCQLHSTGGHLKLTTIMRINMPTVRNYGAG
jgi:hypothetical protein